MDKCYYCGKLSKYAHIDEITEINGKTKDLGLVRVCKKCLIEQGYPLETHEFYKCCAKA